ncbi:MAG: hypothetical protein HYU29_04735 [Chloroflexi bacterium]|nr:hypothetical protein [Chloroflexota bacterium]
MGLRLAGEDVTLVKGVDTYGWLRSVDCSDADPGLKVDQKGSGLIADFQDNGVSKLRILDGGRAVLADTLELGTNPASAGRIRLPNNEWIAARDGANTADVNMVKVGSDGNVRVGAHLFPDVSAQLSLGTTASRWQDVILDRALVIGGAPSATGAVRLQNNAWVAARNAANTGDVNLVRVNAVDEPEIDGKLAIVGGAAFLSMGSNPATGGMVRLPNNQWIAARNGANTANVNMVKVGSDGNVRIGAHLFPDADGDSDIGSSSLRWRDVNASRNLMVRDASGNGLAGLIDAQGVESKVRATAIGDPAQDYGRVYFYDDGATVQVRFVYNDAGVLKSASLNLT